MLGKLIRYEFRSTRRYYLLIYAALVLTSLLTLLLQTVTDGPRSVGETISLSVYILLLLALAALTFVVIIIRFYRNLLGAEGYLMFTLPVTAGQNILGKLIPSFCWSLGSALLAFVTVAMVSGEDFFGKLAWGFSGLSAETWIFMVGFVIAALLLGAGSILFFYLCMAIGQLFNEHKFLASVVTYLVLETVLQIAAILAAVPLLDWLVDKLFVEADYAMSISAAIGWAVGLVAGAFLICLVLFLLTRYLLDKKLNLA